MRKAMVYLGLAEEDERNDTSDDVDEPSAPHETSARDGGSAAVTNLQHQTPVARVVRDVEVGALKRIATIHPRTYNEAKIIGESFRDGTPVIMNLADLDDADAKRLVDFGAGLVFGLYGSIERVTNRVFLLSPVDVEATASEVEARRLAPAASSSRAERMSTINQLRPPEPTVRPAQPPLSKTTPHAGVEHRT
jgi:cell division inhibitor SepF